MKYSVDFKECLKDSPKFRASLEDAEADIDALETKLEKLVKLCNVMIETGKAFNNANSGFIYGIRDLASYFHDDNLVSSDNNKVSASLNRFAHAMNEMLKYFSILMDQANRCVCKNLNNFIKKDIKKVKDAKKHFEKISDDMDQALIRNSSAQKSKTSECEEALNVLTAMKSCFAHTSLDYVFQINVLQSKKRFEVLDTMLSFMHAQNTFFHQGHDLSADLESYMKDVATQVEELSSKAKVERKEMEERHTLVQQREMKPSTINNDNNDDDNSPILSEGYLFKRTTNAFRTWVRRWFTIQNGRLVYRKRSKDSLTIMEEDLRLCTVKPIFDSERRFCFEVVSPARSHMLQAECDDECQKWMNAIITSISRAYRDQTSHNNENSQPDKEENDSSPLSSATVNLTPNRSSPKPIKQMISQQLLVIPGNDKCCDCGAPDPRWASINLGITLCIECSGIHRSFGVHMSKVRSLTLDAWDPEQIKVMMELGNEVINRIYVARLNDSIAVQATPDSKRNVREAWIKAKYITKSFVNKLPGPKSPSGERIKSWSVKKKVRQSMLPSSKPSSQDDSESEDVVSGLMEAVMSVSNKDSDSGLGGSSSDVIVFGTDLLQATEICKNLDLESSESSATEEEEEGDAKSTTSWEDMSKLDPNILLYKAAEARNVPVMLDALSHGADVNWSNKDDEGKTPIMKAVEAGSLTVCEFLLLNGAKLDRKDINGRTPLHHATIQGHTGQVCQFLKRGADLKALDNSGKDPLSIAVDAANADIVTLLRLSKLNEEMQESDGYFGQPSDETFTDVFKDFSNMASNNPEKLKRK